MSELLLMVGPVTDLEQQVDVAIKNGYSPEEVVECLNRIARNCESMAQDIERFPEVYEWNYR